MLQKNIRTLHGITWTDDLGWMDSMEGPMWREHIQKHQARWKDRVKDCKGDARVFSAEIDAANTVAMTPLFQTNEIFISKGGTTFLHWRWKTDESSTILPASDLDVCDRFPGMVWVIEDVKEAKGGEVYQLACYVREKPTPVWTVQAKDSFAPCLAVVGGRVFVLEGQNRLQYKTLVSFNALKGDDRQVHYKESDDMYNLDLQRCSDFGAYMIRTTGPKQDLFWISKDSVTLLESVSLESRRFVTSDHPFGYFTWTAHEGWRASKELQKAIKLPKLSSRDTIESVSCQYNILVTKSKGERTIWCKGQEIWKGIGHVMLDPWKGPWVRIIQPGCEAVWWNCERDPAPVKHLSFTHTMEVLDFDRSLLRTVIVRHSNTKRAKGLLVVGYGAYGIPTNLNTARWQPLLHRGWAVCFGLWRGGGDGSPMWEDAGRLGGREEVLKDAEVVIQAAQKATGCSADSTWLYGRSAGGLWVGGLVASRGRELCSGAYMEVPYLDVLQTTTNPKLPLTLLETDEFGRPAQRLSDFEGMLRWSPMELLRANPTKAKDVQQIVRTGLHDKEVYAYESVKWATRCGENCLLAVEDDQGHFVGGSTALEQEGLDCALLLQLAS